MIYFVWNLGNQADNLAAFSKVNKAFSAANLLGSSDLKAFLCDLQYPNRVGTLQYAKPIVHPDGRVAMPAPATYENASQNLKNELWSLVPEPSSTVSSLSSDWFGAVSYGQNYHLENNFQYLLRCINLYGWFTGDATAKANLANIDPAAKAQQIKALGFTGIRLPIEPSWFNVDPPYTYLDAAVKAFIAQGLGVVLDLHPYEAGTFKQDLATSDAAVTAFASFWKTFSARYAAIHKSLIFFELLNEPHFGTWSQTPAARWATVEAALITAIRQSTTQNTIISKGYGWDEFESLQVPEFSKVANVVYSVHYYKDMRFTHQGADWVSDPITRSTYPVEYPNASFTQAAMESQFQSMATWARDNGVMLWLGEYGVYNQYAPHESLVRWHQDVKAMAEKYAMGWSLWHDGSGFDALAIVEGLL